MNVNKPLLIILKLVGILVAFVITLAVIVLLGLNLFKFVFYNDYFSLMSKEGKNPGLPDNYVPQGITAEAMIFEQSGAISYRLPDGTVVDLNQTFGIYQFNNPSGLEKLSYSRLLPTDASGQPMLEGQMGTIPSKVCQYYLEGSNVQVADEMVNMIIAQRAYEMNSKAIQTADSMLQTANELKR